MFNEIAILTLTLSSVVGHPVELPRSPALFPIEQEIITATNAERARFGLPKLKTDHSLIRSARTHTIWMTRRHSLQHTSQPVGENIAMGQQNTREAVRAWMNSSGHRANILSRRYTRMGAAAYVASDGTIFWCQQFLD